MDLTSWDAAVDRVRAWERQGNFETIEAITIETAVRLFFEDAKHRNLSPATVSKYDVLLNKQLRPFCSQHKLTYLLELDLLQLRVFRGTWSDSPISAIKKIERLRSFFRFCHEPGWIESNPASSLKLPISTATPTLPFTPEEVAAILKACDTYPTQNSFGYDNRSRIRAFILLLLYTGLRIRDVACLPRSKVQKGLVTLYTQKTGTPVSIPLPEVALKSLDALPNEGQYLFWSGNGNQKSTVADWQRSLRRLFKIAKIENGHAHRFRDSFSVRLLERGVPIQDVSILLGHRSVRVTEKHYAPWVQSRQTRLEDLVRSSW